MYLPVLGVRVLCHLEPHAEASSAQQQQLQDEQQQDGQPLPLLQLQQLCPMLVTSATQLQLQPPATVDQHAAAAGGADATAQAGAGSSSSSTPPGGDDALQQRVQAARAAAQQAVVGSSQDAAMDAAERAVRAGFAAVSGGRGYSRLGGIQSYTQALRELVLLPLHMPQLFSRWAAPHGVCAACPQNCSEQHSARAAHTRLHVCVCVLMSMPCVGTADTGCGRPVVCCCTGRQAAARPRSRARLLSRRALRCWLSTAQMC
jgi:hypothetical protein